MQRPNYKVIVKTWKGTYCYEVSFSDEGEAIDYADNVERNNPMRVCELETEWITT